MKRLIVSFLIFTLVINSSGCWDQKIYENSGFVLQVGFEESEQGNLLMLFSTPVIDPSAKEFTELIYSETFLLREFREQARKVSDKLLEGGKIQQILISDTLASKGVNELVEVIEREPTDPPIAYVVIVEDSPLKMVKEAGNFVDKPPRPAIYIHKLIENNIKSYYIPETRIFQFSTLYFAPGIDPIAPVIKLRSKGGKGIEVSGSALFSGDKMTGKINTEQTSMLLAMMGKMKHTVFASKNVSIQELNNGKKGCAVTISKAKRKVSVSIKNDIPVVDISLSLNGFIGELHWNSTYNEEFQKSIEDTLASEIKGICENTIEYTKEAGCDCIGIGDTVRSKYNNYFSSDNWDSVYKNVVFNIDVKFKLLNHGIIQ